MPRGQYLPDSIDLIWPHEINPGKVFDLSPPLDKAAAGWRAIKTMLIPELEPSASA